MCPDDRIYIPAWALVYDVLKRVKGPVNASELARRLGIPRTTVDQALLGLKEKGFVEKVREGFLLRENAVHPVNESLSGNCVACGSGEGLLSFRVGPHEEKAICLTCFNSMVRTLISLGSHIRGWGRKQVKHHVVNTSKNNDGRGDGRNIVYGMFAGKLISRVRRKGSVCATWLGLRLGLRKTEVRRVVLKMAPKMGWTVVKTGYGHIHVMAKEVAQQPFSSSGEAIA